jgi:hypothetical protein
MGSRLASASLLLLALTAFGPLCCLIFLNKTCLIASFHDDAYYYFRIAENIAGGAGSSFDGVSSTNGYQPLWLLILIPISLFKQIFLPDSGVAIYGFVIASGFVLLAWRLKTFLRDFAGEIASIAGILLLIFSRVTTVFTGGMESLILGVLLMWYAAAYHKCLKSEFLKPSDLWLLGFVGGGVVLARLDHAIIIGVFGVLLLLLSVRDLSRPKEIFSNFARLALPPIMALGCYFISNELLFGHWIPISGAIKTEGGLQFQPELWTQDKGVFLLGIASLATFGILCTGYLLGKLRSTAGEFLIAWSAANAAYIMFLGYSVRWVMANWYFVSPILFFVVLTAYILQAVAERHRQSRVLLPIAMAGIVVVVLLSQVDRRSRLREEQTSFPAAMLAAAEWCNRELPENAVIGMADAGVFGYFCKRTVINLDGLVNGWDYIDACRSGQGIRYLRECGLTHVSAVFGEYLKPSSSADFTYAIPAPFARPAGNTFTLTTENILYSREYSFHPGDSESHRFALWLDKY